MKVLLFARVRDLIGADSVDVPASATVGALREALMAAYPHAAGLLAKSMIAVNDDYADDATSIPADAEVALLPPVSGG